MIFYVIEIAIFVINNVIHMNIIYSIDRSSKYL